MKALTLTQPWATLVAIGMKRIETRSWNTNYRGPLAIHAAKGFPKYAKQICNTSVFADALNIHGISYLPLGMIVAVCELVQIVRIDERHFPRIEPELSFGDYSIGRYMWFLKNVIDLLEPIPAKGSLGLWEWEKGASISVVEVGNG